jgi:hypothetical protein
MKAIAFNECPNECPGFKSRDSAWDRCEFEEKFSGIPGPSCPLPDVPEKPNGGYEPGDITPTDLDGYGEACARFVESLRGMK